MEYQIVNPLADAPDMVEVDSYLRSQGWELFLHIGNEDSCLYVRSWRRQHDDSEQYMVEVSDGANDSPYISVPNFGELMDLLARWAPVVQAATISDLIGGIIGSGLSYFGSVERIAAKAVFGAEDVLPEMRRDLRKKLDRAAAERLARANRKNSGR